MTKEERKTRERTKRAEYILDCAEKLILDRKFEDITIEDIAEEAGYAKRSVYLYFNDRGSLYFSLVLRGQRLLFNALSEAADKVSRDGGVIEHFCWAFYNFSIKYPEYFELVMNYEAKTNKGLEMKEDPENPKSLCNSLSEDYGALILHSIIGDMEKNHIHTELTPRQLLLFLWSQIFGFMQVLVTRRENFKEVYLIEQRDLFERFINSISALYSSGMKVG